MSPPEGQPLPRRRTGSAIAPGPAPDADLQVGQTIGPYRLLFRLGKGGMGEVWAAEQGQSSMGFAKVVAVKVLKGAEFGSNSAVMFFDEAKAASALNHASIVATLDLGQAPSMFYIAMEMVGGPSLTALLQRLAVQKTMLSPAIVAYIGERMAGALDYAYNRAQVNGQVLRLVHRDISPHNVLVDQTGAVKLTDFGVARTAVQDHKSRVGTVRGKPSYMAPEQVVGGAIDGRTDIFALGIVLYECASVKRLFGRSNPVKSMDAVINYQPKPLPEIVPGFPPALWEVIAKSLEKDPNQRYQSAGDMARALADVLRTLPGAATVAQDLVEVIKKSFPDASFDADAKVHEARAKIAELDLARGPTTPPIAEPAPSAWPSAHAADPLAPEAIDALKHQLGMGSTPSGSLPAMDPMMMGQTPSGGMVYDPNQAAFLQMTAAQYTASQMSYAQVAPPPSKLPLIGAVAMAGAALAVGAVVFIVQGRRQEVSTTAPEPGTIATPGIQAQAQPGVQPSSPIEEIKPEEVIEEKRRRRVVKPAEGTAEAAGKPAEGATAEAPPEAPKEKPAASPGASSGGGGEPTTQSVMALLRKLKEVDRDAYLSLAPGVAEAGGNVDKLREIEGKVVAKLKEKGL